MLLDRVSSTQSFSDSDPAGDDIAFALPVFDPVRRPVSDSPAPTGVRRGARAAMEEGDRVVFARLDLAEALGIWRHATGLVVGTHDEAPAAPEARITVDVKFDGHETLLRYLPDLFEKRAH